MLAVAWMACHQTTTAVLPPPPTSLPRIDVGAWPAVGMVVGLTVHDASTCHSRLRRRQSLPPGVQCWVDRAWACWMYCSTSRVIRVAYVKGIAVSRRCYLAAERRLGAGRWWVVRKATDMMGRMLAAVVVVAERKDRARSVGTETTCRWRWWVIEGQTTGARQKQTHCCCW